MAIHFVCGRPGAGKGLYSMRLLVDELRFTNRAIVTNLAVLPGVLSEFLQQRFGSSFDLLHRLRMVDDDDIRKFYLLRGGGLDLAVELDKKGMPEKYDINGAMLSGGVFYLLDEVHLAFGARDWQTMGKAVMFYASQHRKLGDDLILVTQAPKNVDAQFRSLAQDYTVLRNHALEKIGLIKQPNVFTKSVYLNLPNGSEVALEHSVFRLDRKMAACYDTSKGVGIQSKGPADVGKDRRKGLHWAWLVGAVVVGCLLVWQLPRFALGRVKESFVRMPGQTTNSPVTNSPAGVITAPVPGVFVPPARPQHTNRVVSLLRNSSGIVFLLDNGREVSDRRHNLKGISNEHITDSDGHIYPLPFALD